MLEISYWTPVLWSPAGQRLQTNGPQVQPGSLKQLLVPSLLLLGFLPSLRASGKVPDSSLRKIGSLSKMQLPCALRNWSTVSPENSFWGVRAADLKECIQPFDTCDRCHLQRFTPENHAVQSQSVKNRKNKSYVLSQSMILCRPRGLPVGHICQTSRKAVSLKPELPCYFSHCRHREQSRFSFDQSWMSISGWGEERLSLRVHETPCKGPQWWLMSGVLSGRALL